MNHVHPSVFLEEATRKEIEKNAPEAVVVVPITAVEQHGEHLPMNTDKVIGEEIAAYACRYTREEQLAYVTPAIPFGNSHHHFPYPALSVTSEALLLYIKELTKSLVQVGFQKIVLLNSHGGNEEAIRITARDLAREYQVSILAMSYWTAAWNELEKHQATELGRVPGHAGGFETSLILHLRNHLVSPNHFPEKREDEIPTEENAKRVFMQFPGNSVGVGGISDDARKANAQQGKKYFEIIVKEVSQTILRFVQQAKENEEKRN